ncbi:hypothetical protein M9Y10_013824 [Tritrichomonas musculus]|uniref:non-specific serine/threonine protein kinase n=1 Tax=Tritrichomonas musculus TaxID=1915356 RepID=A0ABR2KYP2_9EUKA
MDIPIDDKNKDSIVIQDVLRKKSTKFGIWYKRLVQLTKNQIIVYKEETAGTVLQKFDIYPTTTVECFEEEKPPRFVCENEGNPMVLIFTHDNIETVIKWVNEIRNITIQTPGLSMDNFDILSVIGRGFYGKVQLVKKKGTNELYALKSVHKSLLIEHQKVHTILSERNVLMKTKHPFLVDICFAFQTSTKVYLGLEYVAGGELFTHMRQNKKLPVEEVRLYVAELSLAIDYLHSQNIIYRDLKPENVLLSMDGHVKLTDFGLAKMLSPDLKQAETFCGTNEYLAPEIVQRMPYGPPIDWWALGILTYELLFGISPFHESSKLKIFKGILNDSPKYPDDTDETIKSFIAILLEKDPSKRAHFVQIKSHPFFKGLNFQDVLEKKYQPIYVPPETGGLAGNFDEEFTNEKCIDSSGELTFGESHEFHGFSFYGGLNKIGSYSSGDSNIELLESTTESSILDGSANNNNNNNNKENDIVPSSILHLDLDL